MAQIVLGIGTSHGSQVSLTPDWWPKHGQLDKARTRYDELVKHGERPWADQLTPEVWERKYIAVQAGVKALGDTLQSVNPDVLLVVGDDQGELFPETRMPALAIFAGKEVWDYPRDLTNVPESRKTVMWAKHAQTPEPYPVPAELARHLVSSMMVSGFDVTHMSDQPEGKSVGHAFTFVRLRLMGERVIPMVPIMLNTYFPPNQPTAARCYAFGGALRAAVDSWPEELRVGIVASGGLSHFVVDEELDGAVLRAIEHKTPDVLTSIPEQTLQSGSSEIKNWIVTAGALTDMPFSLVDYVPGYRSDAGTGCGMAFGYWQ